MARKTAVLYARYSSDKQREASIDDQLRVCRDWCERERVDVVAEYKDYALSGKTDHRPEFRRMIANAPESDYVVVYMFDRFSRDRYDAATYKKSLRECGVRVISAMEKVEDTPEGGLQEGLLEILSEYYVKDLARKVRRGMEGNALKARDNGYRIFGYRTDPATRKYVVEPAEAACVREMFAMHIGGRSVNSIASEMARRGWTTSTGKPVDYNWAWRVLNRHAYTGLYSWGGIEVPGGMPVIVDEDTFRRSQAVVPRKRRADETWEDYRLTGKLFCGFCGLPMHGTAGTGKKGRRYHYYACKESGGCGRPWVRRELVEDSIADKVLEVCSDERKMRLVAKRIVEAYAEPGKEKAEMEAVEAKISALQREQHNISQAAMRGVLTDEMVTRNGEIDDQLRSLRNRHGVLASQMCEITEDDIVGYMMHGFNRDDGDFIFGSVVNKAYLFADCVLLVFNFRDELGSLEEVRFALQAQKKCEPGSGFALCSSGVPGKEIPETILPLPGGFGVIIPLAA